MREKIKITERRTREKVKNPVHVSNKSNDPGSNASFTDRVLHLQRTIGNREVTRLIRSGILQAKLSIGQPGDIYEQEADRVAEQVMRMPDEKQSLVNSQWSFVQRKSSCPACEEEEKPISLKASGGCGGSDVMSCVESHINALKGSGQSLSPGAREFFEPRFGADFSQVRVHNGSDAAAIATEINAKAFTTGNDIFFNTGQYSPGTSGGKSLLAHELTHTLQQKSFSALRIQASNNCTYGEIRSWAVTGPPAYAAPAGLADAKASIGAVCARGNPCSCVDGSTATAPADQAAWRNIVAANGGADQTGGGNFMCVGSQNCWFVHSCYSCAGGRRTQGARAANLATSGTCSVGANTLYFYDDPLRGWCNNADYRSGCRAPAPRGR